MMKEVYNDLAYLQAKLSCNKVIFAVVSVLISIVLALIGILFAIVLIPFIAHIFVFAVVGYCGSMPFVVIYQCVKHKCKFILED